MAQETKFCSKCGVALPEGAAFCSKCGAPVTPTTTPPPPPPSEPYRREYRMEKHEKHEKREKHEKGEKAEKGGDRIGPVIGGLIVIWLGFSFYLAQTDLIRWANWWAYFLTGLGVIIILQGLIRGSQTGLGYHLSGSFIGGAIVLLIGITFLMGFRDFWPIVLVVIGIAIIASATSARRRSPRP